MKQARAAKFLRLVHDRPEADDKGDFARFEPVQVSLLADSVATAFVCTTEDLDEKGFVELFTTLHAKLALDLRITPRFDFGTLNRRRALALFEGLSVRYLDLGLKAPTLESCLSSLDGVTRLHLAPSDAIAPNVVVFVDPEPDYRDLGRAIGQHFRRKSESDWEVVLRGPEEPSRSSRHVVFISHANPEDNNFVLWLQAQLQRLGYEVWSDLSRLRGGELFWESIESTIRSDAARVVVVVSESSMSKEGVLDEVALAVSVERSERISGFVIPIRIDKTPFSSLRANVARKNVVDFSGGWGKGLSALVGAFRRDNVPRGAGRLDAMLQLLKQDTPTRVTQARAEVLTSNRLLVSSIPKKLYFMAGMPSTVNAQSEVADFPQLHPFTPYRGGWLTFLSPSETIAGGFQGLQLQGTQATDEFRAGNVSLTSQLRAGERDRLISRVLNAHLNFALVRRGLLPLRDAVPPTLYVPARLVEKDQVSFVDVDGRTHRRLLVGRSERRQLYWHLGLSAKFLSASNSVQLRLRVIFTSDGASATIPVDRMKDARRSFCKNWWNDRWRSLELALLAWLSGGSDSVVIHAGEAGDLSLSARPQQVSVPVSIDEVGVLEVPEAVGDDGAVHHLPDDEFEALDEDVDVDVL